MVEASLSFRNQNLQLNWANYPEHEWKCQTVGRRTSWKSLSQILISAEKEQNLFRNSCTDPSRCHTFYCAAVFRVTQRERGELKNIKGGELRLQYLFL